MSLDFTPLNNSLCRELLELSSNISGTLSAMDYGEEKIDDLVDVMRQLDNSVDKFGDVILDKPNPLI